MPKKPLRFGHFEVLEDERGWPAVLGRGAMGITYKARDTRLDRVVAVKVIPPEARMDKKADDRFLREARAAAQINHPHVAMILELGEAGEAAGGGRFYAMEFCEGETLEDYVKRMGRLAPESALGIARQVALALAATHRKRVVHRDVKPGNIMLIEREGQEEAAARDAPRVKLIDFGLARTYLEGESMEDASVFQFAEVSDPGEFTGTPAYASPEQIQGEALDIRSDIYSLGGTMWFMLSGVSPFRGSIGKVIHQNLERPPDKGDLPPGLPTEVIRVLDRMLAKGRDDRFQSPDELLEALDRCAGGGGSPPPEPPAPSPPEGGTSTVVETVPFRPEPEIGAAETIPARPGDGKTPAVAEPVPAGSAAGRDANPGSSKRAWAWVWGVLIVAAVLLGFYYVPLLKGEDVGALVAEGNGLRAHGDLAGAVAAYDRALRRSPGNPAALLGRGCSLLAQNKPDTALVDFNRLLAEKPRLAFAHVCRGRALQELGKPDDAEAAFLQGREFEDADGEGIKVDCQLDRVSYREGDTMRLTVRLEKPGYLRVYYRDAAGNLRVLQPPGERLSGKGVSIAPGKPVTFTTRVSGKGAAVQTIKAVVSAKPFLGGLTGSEDAERTLENITIAELPLFDIDLSGEDSGGSRGAGSVFFTVQAAGDTGTVPGSKDP